jgi:hypothetical protein
MIKHYCDLCKEELKQGERRRKYRIKQFKKTDYDFRWIELEVHDSCVDKILEVVFCADEDNPLKKVKTAEPITRTRYGGKSNDD